MDNQKNVSRLQILCQLVKEEYMRTYLFLIDLKLIVNYLLQKKGEKKEKENNYEEM